MTKLLQIVLAVVITVNLTGCATAYMRDRGADAKDIVTMSVQRGVGVDAQVSFVTCALGINTTYFGLEDGRVINNTKGTLFAIFPDESCTVGILAAGCPVLCVKGNGGEVSSFGRVSCDDRHKRYIGGFILGIPLGFDFAGTRAVMSPHCMTKVELAASLGLGLRLGLNPGELIDFLLGWIGVDIYDDDIESQKAGRGGRTDKAQPVDASAPQHQH